MLTRPVLEEWARELCRIFLGWKLGDDHDALLGMEEGALHVDLRTAECSCDGDPIPPLFIAGELRSWLERGLERTGATPDGLGEARLEALFATRHQALRGRTVPTLRLACRVRLATATDVAEAEANNG